MTPEQKELEEKWASQLFDLRSKFKARVEGALNYAGKKTKRKLYYSALKEEIGADAAREVAKFSEAIITGQIQRPKWFVGLPDGYVPVPRV